MVSHRTNANINIFIHILRAQQLENSFIITNRKGNYVDRQQQKNSVVYGYLLK
jgi:hypothetical protein